MKCFLPLVCCLFAVVSASAQVQLNEFLASNTQATPDIVDFDDYPDWIELKNTSGADVNLNGYFLSDDPAKPLKWPFPATALINANGFLRVWADAHDAVPGQSAPRGYWPWRNFTVEAYHTNFSLSSLGESVVLTKASGLTSVDLILAAQPVPTAPATAASWKYLANGSDQSTQWRAANFTDTAWSSGTAPLGYGDPWIVTTVPYGPNASAKYITTYFRNTFTIANPALIANLTLRLMVDDGAVVYLNGVEVVRRNLPTTEITYQTLASVSVGGTDEQAFTTYNIPAT